MPTYDYKCGCGFRANNLLRAMKDISLTCPVCGQPLEPDISAPPTIWPGGKPSSK